MALWQLHGNGTLAPGEVVKPDERLGWGKTVALGLQHVVAMFGATFLVPLITGFPPSTTLFFSAVGTITFLLITGNKLPSYLGSSFAFIAPILAAKEMDGGGFGKALFGVLIAGLVLALVGALVHFVGAGWIQAFMPPVMTGTIVMLIGFNLAGAAWGSFEPHQVTGWVTVIAVVLIAVLFRGLIGRLSILLGVAVGYVVALIQGEVDFTPISQAAWFGLPEFHTPTPDWTVIGMFIPVVLVLIAENVGHVKSVALMTGADYDKRMGRALLADGVATSLAALGGGSGTTTYAENIGVMAATKVYSTAVYWVAAFAALLLALIPKFGAAVNTVPGGVIGGAGVVLYGMIGLLGARIWVENKVDFTRPTNLFPAAIALILGIADASVTIGSMTLTGIAVGTIAAFVIFHLMRALARWRGTDVADDIEGDSFVLYDQLQAQDDSADLR